ncbi:MAG: hypothetical protein F2621_02250 [Actinobacteria bacterium]|uniref:Unannotated protein n=1 Tax=freshwater metagenome TaxID=449393 RepID=A0A6J6EI93_9ZZZZ|nr:hypothetical protein [Actinomycetota bacterium]MTA33261.1 hypothetical protein [Actinomycetota bacterium]
MAKWLGPWPVCVDYASGAHFTCVDGIDHIDLCLGATIARVLIEPAMTNIGIVLPEPSHAVVVGKTIGSGIPAGAYGMTAELQEKVRANIHLEDIDVGGVGRTLAGNALSLAGIRATLADVAAHTAHFREAVESLVGE